MGVENQQQINFPKESLNLMKGGWMDVCMDGYMDEVPFGLGQPMGLSPKQSGPKKHVRSPLV